MKIIFEHSSEDFSYFDAKSSEEDSDSLFLSGMTFGEGDTYSDGFCCFELKKELAINLAKSILKHYKEI